MIIFSLTPLIVRITSSLMYLASHPFNKQVAIGDDDMIRT
jgi:hypothetical protein